MRAWAWHRGLPTLPLILLLALLALGAGLGMREPMPPDEPRFVLAARTMVETGDWLIPRRGSELYAHKPPVFMWLQAGAYRLLGDWRIAFLLPSLLAALGTLWLTWDLARRLWNRRVAAYAALALLATLQFGLQAKRAQIDMVLVCLTTLALWALARHLLLARDRRLSLLGGVAAGVGTVTKGVGFLPLLVFLPWRLLPAARRGEGGSGLALALAGLGAGALVWVGPMLWQALGGEDPALRAYAGDILLRQTGQRYVDPWHHHQPPWYFLQVILTLWLPGALLLPWLLPAWVRRLRRRDRRHWLLLGWGLLVLLFFSLSPGKREVYILPALPAFCLAAAPLLPGLLRRAGVRGALWGWLLALAGALLLVGIAGLADLRGFASRAALERAIAPADAALLFACSLAIGAAGLLLALGAGRRRAGAATVVFMLLLWSGYGLGLMPALSPSSSAQAVMRAVGARIGPEAELGLLGWSEQNLLQADRRVVDFGFERPWHAQWRDAGQWLSEAPARRWLFVLDEALSPCVDRARTLPAGRSNRRDWLLVPGQAWPAGCITPEGAPGAADPSAPSLRDPA